MALNVVSNAGPLILFSKLNILYLLKELYGRVEFPFAVYKEAVQLGIRYGFPDARTLHLFLTQNKWKPTQVIDIPLDLKDENLDSGEKEAIALAISKNALLLMDEERGRSFARSKNIKGMGSLGVLIEAYKKKHISEDQLRVYFQQISDRKDIWINPDLCKRLLGKLFQTDVT